MKIKLLFVFVALMSLTSCEGKNPLRPAPPQVPPPATKVVYQGEVNGYIAEVETDTRFAGICILRVHLIPKRDGMIEILAYDNDEDGNPERLWLTHEASGREASVSILKSGIQFQKIPDEKMEKNFYRNIKFYQWEILRASRKVRLAIKKISENPKYYMGPSE